MDIVEKVLKEMETPEGKEKMKKWADRYIEEQRVRDQKIKDIITNTSYVEWLNQFTQDKDGFADDEWLYFPEEISSIDRENVGVLNLFYEGISKYASENHIYPIPCDFGNFYRVKLNDFAFEIGILVGQGTVFFVNKVSLEEGKEFIDFNYIMNDKKQDNVDNINAMLEALSNMVITAYDNGVPVESIVNKLDSTIRDISSKKENKIKVLVRK